MRKGFTLVELLAVIVILAVIALITTPILLNVIESSRKSTALNSAEGYVRAVSNYLIMNEVSDGLYSVLDNNIKAEYTGTGPSNGSITIKKGDIESANLCINKYSIDYIDGVSSISENDYCKDTNNKTLIIKKNNEQVKKVYIGASTNTSIEKEEGTNVVCNNGVTIKEEDGKIKVENILGNSECNFSNNLEETINNIDSTKNNILLLSDINLENTLAIPEGKDVAIDLNGKTVTAASGVETLLSNKGKLTINDKIGTGTMGTTRWLLGNDLQTAELVINGGNFIKKTSDQSGGGVIGNSGTTTVNGGKFYSEKAYVVYNYSPDAIFNVNGGTFESPTAEKFVNMSNGTFNIKNIKIVNSVEDRAVFNNYAGGIFNISNVEVSSNGINTVYNAGSGVINIKNSTISTTNEPLIRNNENGTINIDGGKYTSSGNVIANYSSKDINIVDTSGKVYIYTDGITAKDWWLARDIVNFNSGNIKIKGSIADKCGEEENTSGICVYNKNGRGITNDSTSTGNIYINGVFVFSENFVAVNNFSKSDIYICKAKLNGTENDISINNTGNVYYTSNVVLENSTTQDSSNNPSHIILKEDITCE